MPQVYLFEATQDYRTCFIAEQFIEGASLSSAWMSFTPTHKESVALKISYLTVDLAEVQFDKIGGLNIRGFSSAPTVEGSKIFKSRR